MQVGSRLDHGGTWFQAITAEVGYAKTRYLKLIVFHGEFAEVEFAVNVPASYSLPSYVQRQ